MMQAVKGIYRDGKVELLEPPSGITEGEVIVTFVQPAVEKADSTVGMAKELALNKPKMIRFGMLSNGTEQFSETDFKSAEFHGDSDDLDRA